MLGLQTLDVVIGLIFIYLLLASVCTVTMEVMAGIFDRRTRNLRLGIMNLLGEPQPGIGRRVSHAVKRVVPKLGSQDKADSGLINEFYSHPLIKTLQEDGTPPSYIPPAAFALTIVDIFAPSQGMGRTVENFTTGVKTRLQEPSDLRRNLLILVDESGQDMAKLKANLEEMFNNSMERVAGWYKNKTQVPLLIFALLLCTLTNADTLRLAKSLYNDGALRAALVAQAQEDAKQWPLARAGGAQEAVPKLDGSVSEIKRLGLKIGWDQEEWQALVKDWESQEKWPKEWPFRLFGILITSLAVSLGAPFWFDFLNRLVNIRAVGKSPDEKKASSTTS